MTPLPALPDWQRAHGGPLLTAIIRSSPEDFQVTEVLGFEPSGDGEHDLLRLEKTNANTLWVARGLARLAGVPVRDVGFAGLKDRHAKTVQWFSVRRATGEGTNWNSLELPGVRVLRVERNQRKLRPGAHAGNEFRIALRGITHIDEPLERLLHDCSTLGVPNYFGEQRFGREFGNIELARSFFAGKRMKRDERSLAISAARSLLFNDMLSCRVQDGSWNTLRSGDLASLDGSGSVFEVNEADATLVRRCQEFDIHPSAALWGKGEPGSRGAVAELEKSVAAKHPELAAGLERHADQARRALRLHIKDFRWALDADALWLEFFLVSGGFATALLREITR
ncbi:MAG: tRNA pseudouridine(13) synthase TruD [Woeseiaceae bacterium]